MHQLIYLRVVDASTNIFKGSIFEHSCSCKVYSVWGSLRAPLLLAQQRTSPQLTRSSIELIKARPAVRFYLNSSVIQATFAVYGHACHKSSVLMHPAAHFNHTDAPRIPGLTFPFILGFLFETPHTTQQMSSISM